MKSAQVDRFVHDRLPPRLAWRGADGLLAGPGVHLPWVESGGRLAALDIYVSGYSSGGAELATGEAVEATGAADGAASGFVSVFFSSQPKSTNAIRRNGTTREDVIASTVRRPVATINGKDEACDAS